MKEIRLPVRIQRSRERGWRQPPNTKYCGRPSRYANPFVIGRGHTRASSLAAFRRAFWSKRLPVTPKKAYRELRRYDYLSCWCAEGEECHVDEYILAIRIRYAKRRAVCLYCPHRLADHFSIEIENEVGVVHAMGAACPQCNTIAPSDLYSDGLCLVRNIA